MVPPTAVRVFPTLPLLVAWFADVVRALSLAKNFPYSNILVGELGRYVKEVGSCSWSPSPKLVDECFAGHAVDEGAHHIDVSGVREFFPF